MVVKNGDESHDRIRKQITEEKKHIQVVSHEK